MKKRKRGLFTGMTLRAPIRFTPWKSRLLAAVSLTVISAGEPPGMGPLGRSAVAESVPLVRVLSRPQDFDERRVRVSGYVSFGFEKDAVFLDEVSYNAALYANAIWISAPTLSAEERARFSRKYAYVEGVFDADLRGHMGDYSGALKDARVLAPIIGEDEFLRRTSPRLPLWLWAAGLALAAGLAGLTWRWSRRR